jgi:hypothetical protein
MGPDEDPKYQAYAPNYPFAEKTSKCQDIKTCKINTVFDSEAYAFMSWQGGTSCIDALKDNGPRLDDDDKSRLVCWYHRLDSSADCQEMNKWTAAWTSTAIVVSRGYGSYFRHALKVLPTISIGVPVTKWGNADAQTAIKGVSGLAGLTVRYSPVGFWASVEGFLGTASVSAGSLDKQIYPSPALLIAGVALSVMDGLVGMGINWASLRKDGISDSSAGTATTLEVSIDLTSAVLGLVQKQKE